MELSKRLEWIYSNIDNCEKIADIGTDHGYIPIRAVKSNRVRYAIASDINKDPVNKAKMNISLENLEDKIEGRLGGGLKTIKKNEVNGVVIAGMGGNLTRDILEDDMDKVKELDFLILQPAQNPEVLRKYLYSEGYNILKEDLCFEEGIYYELFKVKKEDGNTLNCSEFDYEFSPLLIREKHPLMYGYLKEKEEKYLRILSFIKDEGESAKKRKKSVEEKLKKIEEILNEVK